MNIKRVLFVILILSSFTLTSFCSESKSRYIVFFAQTSDVPDVVLSRISSSDSFFLTVPCNASSEIAENLKELASVGKVELAVSLNPEPVLPVLAMITNTDLKKFDKNNIFDKYITDNFQSFRNNSNKNDFGMFLSSGKMSRDVLAHLALGFQPWWTCEETILDDGTYQSDLQRQRLKLFWITADNIEDDTCGMHCDVGNDNISVFSLYKNFPFNQQDIIKWLESKHEDVIPVLLTSKHLQDTNLMEYLISLFNGNKYTVKSATPLFVINEVNRRTWQRHPVSFKNISLDPSVLEKLHLAVAALTDYMNSSSFNENVYANVQSELIYLCGDALLKNRPSSNILTRRTFDVVYGNIYRLLGTQPEANSKRDFKDTQNTFTDSVIFETVPNGIVIHNDGILKLVRVVSRDVGVDVMLSFNSGIWNDQIAFVDFYIDLNGITKMGCSSFIPGVTGFLVSDSGWDYAVRIYKNKAVLYKYSINGATIISNLTVDNGVVTIPNKYIRGNPSKWGFQAVLVSEIGGKNNVVDFLNYGHKSKNETLSANPLQLPLLRHLSSGQDCNGA